VDFLYKPLDIRVVKSKVKVFKELEQQKLVIQDQLEQLSQALKWRDDFLSIASHELKTPITSLRLQTQMLTRNIEQNEQKSLPIEKLQRYFLMTGKQLDRLTRLIDDLLDTTKIRAGKLMVEPIEVNFSQMVEDILERFSEQLIIAGCYLKMNLQENVMVRCDPFRAEQVIVNILSNVIKYAANTPVEVTLVKDENQSILKIQDDGPGIPKEKIATIFDRFQRGNRHEGISGLGLGLYIAKEIMDAHHAMIKVESTIGDGCTFTLCFENA
jgi:signal transduction histidine kinase